MTRYPALIGILLLGAALLPAQVAIERPIPMPAVPAELKAFLSLTDSQADALAQVQKSRMDADNAIYRQISEKQRALNALIESGSRDAMQVGQLMIDIAALRKQVSLSETYRASALAVLSADQKAKLPVLAAILTQQNTAWQAVNWNLIDSPAPPARILPIDVEPGQPRLLPMPVEPDGGRE